MRRKYTTRRTFAQNMQFARFIEATASLEAQVGQLFNRTHGSQLLGDLRSILINASNGKQTQTTIIEVEN